MFSSEDKPTVLVVDDDPTAVRLLQMVLELRNYRVLVAYSGSEALELIRKCAPSSPGWQPLPIDSILLDIMMPGIDGFKVCQQLKDDPLFRHIPVIMVTALKSDADKITAVEFGADGYLTKPFSTEELEAVIKAKLQIKRREEELLRRNAELELINAVSAVASATLNPRRVLEESVRQLLTFAPLCAVAVYLIDQSGTQLQRVLQRGIQRPETASLREGLLARIVRTEQPQLISTTDEPQEPVFQVSEGNRIGVFIGVPLRGVERSLGVLELYGSEPENACERDTTVFLTIGDRIGSALENALLFENAQILLEKSTQIVRPTGG